MNFGELSWRRRRELVALALDGVLRTLDGSHPTFEVTKRVCRHLGTTEETKVAKIVLALAPSRVEARKVPGAKNAWGGQPWVWDRSDHRPSDARPICPHCSGSGYLDVATSAPPRAAAKPAPLVFPPSLEGLVDEADWRAHEEKRLAPELQEPDEDWTINPKED